MSRMSMPRGSTAKDPFLGSTFVVEDEADAIMASIVRTAAQLMNQGRFTEAETHLRQGLDRDPRHPRCLAFLSVCLAANGRKYATAEKIAKSVVQANPDEPAGHFALGKVNLLGARRSTAFRHFARARELATMDEELQEELKRADPRRPAVFPSLPRNHFLNVLCGRFRAAWVRLIRG
jgi:tetratricopeptide (TPR) repeat protein